METRINPGEFDTLITYHSVSFSAGTQGQKTRTETLVGNAWAKVETDVNEKVSYDNIEQGQYLSVTTWKVSSLRTSWVVTIGGVKYGITAIDPISRFSRFCVLTCSAIV